MGEREHNSAATVGETREAPDVESERSSSYEVWKRQVEADARRGLRAGIRGVGAYAKKPGVR